jgi:crossover junction endodeoxyribonuclease RuvC
MVEKKGPACDAGPLKAESYNQHALFRANAFQSQPLFDVSAAAMDAVVFGIDPGAHGAIAVISAAGQLLDVIDMPSTPEANGRTATNAPLLAGILARWHARVAFCEFVGARPTDAKVAAFSFGRARGVIEGVCGALSLPVVFIAPPVWKRLADIPPGAENKDLARTRAPAGRRTRIYLLASATSIAPRPV